jgi:hypothetical protein
MMDVLQQTLCAERIDEPKVMERSGEIRAWSVVDDIRITELDNFDCIFDGFEELVKDGRKGRELSEDKVFEFRERKVLDEVCVTHREPVQEEAEEGRKDEFGEFA